MPALKAPPADPCRGNIEHAWAGNLLMAANHVSY